MVTPPYRIETDRLVIRCWEPRDASMLKDAVDSSLEHLRRWMAWAHDDPQPLSEKIDLLRTFRGSFDLGQDFAFAVLAPDEGEVLGAGGLHPRAEPRSLEIGYWVRESRTRQGIATEIAAVLTRVGIEYCDALRVEIRVEAGNSASAAVCRRVGFAREAVLRGRLELRDGRRGDAEVYSLFAGDVDVAALGAPAFRAFDAAGRPMSSGDDVGPADLQRPQ